jgi:hypothetical protein
MRMIMSVPDPVEPAHLESRRAAQLRRTAFEAELDREHLAHAVAAHRVEPAKVVTAVRERDRKRLGLSFAREALGFGVEHVEREHAAGHEVPSHARERRELRVDVEQVRERPKRAHDQPEALRPEIKPLHLGPGQTRVS